jgi:sugar phosphate isomerase/epimerase
MSATFGMPTLIETADIARAAAIAKRLGFSFVEINMNLPAFQPQALDVALCQKIARDEGLFFTLHLDENFNPCDFNERVASAWTDTYRHSLDIAEALECPLVNMHMPRGVHFSLPGEKVYLFDRFYDRYREGLLRVAKDKRPGVAAAIENTGIANLPFVRRGMETLLEQGFCLTWDVGHDYAANDMDAPFWMEHADKVRHMHLHGATRSAAHLPPDEGGLDVKSRLRFAKEHDLTVVVEVKTEEALSHSAQVLREWGEMPR